MLELGRMCIMLWALHLPSSPVSAPFLSYSAEPSSRYRAWWVWRVSGLPLSQLCPAHYSCLHMWPDSRIHQMHHSNLKMFTRFSTVVTETISKSQLCLILHHTTFDLPFSPILTTWHSIFPSTKWSLPLCRWLSQKPQNTDHHMAPLVMW